MKVGEVEASGVTVVVVVVSRVSVLLSSYLKWRSASVSELILTSSEPDGLRCRLELEGSRGETRRRQSCPPIFSHAPIIKKFWEMVTC